MKRETRNHILIVMVVAAVIVPLYFVPALNRVFAPLLNVLQVLASLVHLLVITGFVLLVGFVVGARLWWRRENRRAKRAARERDGFEVRQG